MNPSVQAFRIFTMEGSRMVAFFEPLHQEGPLLFGRLAIVGHSVTAGRKIKVIGIGALPEPGGRLVVDDRPIEILQMDGEPVPVYPSETINAVVPLPD